MPSQHKSNPVSFRPPEGDRAWLEAYAKAAGRSVGAVLAEALAAHREHIEKEKANENR